MIQGWFNNPRRWMAVSALMCATGLVGLATLPASSMPLGQCPYANSRNVHEPDATLAVGTIPLGTRVFLDGRDTGRVTPVRLEEPLRVRHGIHRLTLVTSDGRHFNYEADVQEGKNAVIVPYPGSRTVGGPARLVQ